MIQLLDDDAGRSLVPKGSKLMSCYGFVKCYYVHCYAAVCQGLLARLDIGVMCVLAKPHESKRCVNCRYTR